MVTHTYRSAATAKLVCVERRFGLQKDQAHSKQPAVHRAGYGRLSAALGPYLILTQVEPKDKIHLVIAATSSPEVNSRVSRDAENLVNIIDLPADGNFIVPSVVRRGPLTIAVSTEGASPAVAKAIRKEIEKEYDAEFVRYLRFVETLRNKALKKIKDGRTRERFLKSLASAEMISLLRKKGFNEVSSRILETFDKIK